jgi:hypothetical protein
LSPLQIPLAPALEAVGIYRQIPIRFVDVELEESLKIAGELGIYAYDAYLIRCALKYRAPLISLECKPGHRAVSRFPVGRGLSGPGSAAR